MLCVIGQNCEIRLRKVEILHELIAIRSGLTKSLYTANESSSDSSSSDSSSSEDERKPSPKPMIGKTTFTPLVNGNGVNKPLVIPSELSSQTLASSTSNAGDQSNSDSDDESSDSEPKKVVSAQAKKVVPAKVCIFSWTTNLIR
jgi:hypothetical protein